MFLINSDLLFGVSVKIKLNFSLTNSFEYHVIKSNSQITNNVHAPHGDPCPFL